MGTAMYINPLLLGCSAHARRSFCVMMISMKILLTINDSNTISHKMIKSIQTCKSVNFKTFLKMEYKCVNCAFNIQNSPPRMTVAYNSSCLGNDFAPLYCGVHDTRIDVSLITVEYCLFTDGNLDWKIVFRIIDSRDYVSLRV